ncbi:MAG: RagB/SusD family nutrient uptake outer membrane protein [Saprospiraceae bacterium]|nr:RagB/SusD family nutrient uptake outer membrane protein [Saprospiraceae bacterium]
MKNLSYSFIFSSLLALTAIGSGCKKDWLSPAPENTLIQTDSTFLDANNAEKFVHSCYNWTTQWGQHVFSWIGMSSITSDDADKGSDPGDLGADKDQMDALSYGPTSLSVLEVWEANYTGIGRCNQAIDNVPKFIDAGLDASLANRLVGEAKFLRAYFYFNLVRCYGDIPKIARVYTGEEAAQIYEDYSNTPRAEIYALIEQDLKDASAVLPLKSQYATKDVGRATKGAADALLAKVYLYQSKWNECLTACNDVINSGEYELESDFSLIWRQSHENGAESIFEIEGQNGAEGWGIGGYFVTQGARGPVTGGYNGWGFNTPTDDLEAAFEADDVRKAATMYYVGQTLWDGAVVESASNSKYNYKAYASQSQEANYDSWWSGKNIRIMRLGEVLLMKAEAANEQGNSGDAIAALNQIRNRAGLGNTTASSQSDLREAIRQERRVEMAMEHDRFFDLVRTGRAGTVLRAHGKNFVDGKHEVFPIPQKHIDLSAGKLKQNSGY